MMVIGRMERSVEVCVCDGDRENGEECRDNGDKQTFSAVRSLCACANISYPTINFFT